MPIGFFKNRLAKRFQLDKFQLKTFGGESRSNAKPGPAMDVEKATRLSNHNKPKMKMAWPGNAQNL